MADIIIVGMGNPYRSDDAVGGVVVDGLREKVGPHIKLEKQRGDIAELIDIFSHHKSVYVVDACSGHGQVGTWRRIDVHKQSIIEDNPQTSTHGFSVSQAISLAKNLGQLPHKLILYVVHSDRYSIGKGLSPPVITSVDAVIKSILNEEDIQLCMNRAS